MNIFEIATNISTPLMLAGFVSAAIFLISKQIIQKKLIPTLNRVQSLDLIKTIINRLFQLSVIAMILGFAAKFVPDSGDDKEKTETLTSEQKRIIEDWKANSVPETAINDITSNSMNSRYGIEDFKRSGWYTDWHTPDGRVIANFPDQTTLRIYLRESGTNLLIGTRDFIGNITPSYPYNILGSSLKADVYRISQGQSPPKLIIKTDDFNSMVFVIGTYHKW
ncbi:hypothetical protein [Ekhidna sp.]